MKKVALLLLLSISFFVCSSNDENNTDPTNTLETLDETNQIQISWTVLGSQETTTTFSMPNLHENFLDSADEFSTTLNGFEPEELILFNSSEINI